MVFLPLPTVSCMFFLFKEPLHSRLGIQWMQDPEGIFFCSPKNENPVISEKNIITELFFQDAFRDEILLL